MERLASIAWLVAALALGGRWRTPWVQALALVLATVAGTTLPDLDLPFGLGHRSALTHSVLPILLTAWMIPALRAPVGGLALGMALHLAADCFPNAMRGYATVKLPFAGSIGAAASYLWLAVNAAAAAVWGAAGLVTLPSRAAIAAAVGAAGTGIAYLLVTDGGWPALGIFAAFGWLAVRRRRSASPVR